MMTAMAAAPKPPNAPASEPAEKILTLLEALARRGHTLATHGELQGLTGLPGATLLRMLRTLEKRGYISRDNDKRYRPLFHLERDLPWGEPIISRLRGELVTLLKHTGESAELLTVRGTDLYWYDKIEPISSPVRIMAQRGSTRTLHELDAPSRLVLRHLGPQWVEDKLDRGRLRGILAPKEKISPEEARVLIEHTDPDAVVFDDRGNANGIRRYAVAVRHRGGALAFLFAVAEAALPAHDAPAHRKIIGDILVEVRDRAENLIR